MRKLVLVVLAIGALVAAVAIYLTATTPRRSVPLRFPLDEPKRRLLAAVPPAAEAFALIPAAAGLDAKLRANPVTRQPVEEWSEGQSLPRAWMLGGADLVAWRAERGMAYGVKLDRLRALLLRGYFYFTGQEDGLILLDGSANNPVGELALTAGLPEGDALVVQRQESRGAYPPISRPAATSLKVTPEEIVIVSRARSGAPPPLAAPEASSAGAPSVPAGAMVSAWFSEPPAVTRDLGRIFGTNLSALLRRGGSIILYEVDTGTLLPRPRGLIVIPADPETRAAVARIARVASMVGEVREEGERILISFDGASMGRYRAETLVPGSWPATEWAVRADPRRLVPVLEELGDSTALRLATPRLYRSIRDLRRWIRNLAAADSIEAARTTTGDLEELSVRIRTK